MPGVGYEWVPLLLATLRGIEPYEVRQVLEDKRPRWPRRAVGAGVSRCWPFGAGPGPAGA